MKFLLPILGILMLSCSANAQETISRDSETGPSTQHQVLNALVGDWTYTQSIWPAPGLTPETSTGVTSAAWVLGGRYVRQESSADFLGEKYEGIGFVGYDRNAEVYTYVWMDNRGTETWHGAGTYDSDMKSITIEGTFFRAGLDLPFKVVLKLDSADAYTMEMWRPGVYDILNKSYEISYKRK